MKRKRELIDDILDPFYNFEDDTPEEFIATKCLKCGFEDSVPSSIYDEFAVKKFHKEINKRVETLNCQRCDTEKFIPKKYFKD